MRAGRLAFHGHIAGFGTGAGVRMVIGIWSRSPFGAFTDVMVQTRRERTLLAPTAQVAEFVSSTYRFDRVVVGPVDGDLSTQRLTVDAPELQVEVSVGGPAPLDRLLRLVPGRLGWAPWWLRAIDPVAGLLVPGVRTAGTAGNGRREYYGVRRSRLISDVAGSFHRQDLGGLAPLDPPVEFGFSSAPLTPQIVSVTTTIDMPHRVRGRVGLRGSPRVGENGPQ